jgi:ABC-type molybdate transport system substrate-binding protein
VLPSSGALLTSIAPARSVTIAYTSDSPSPVPWPIRLVVNVALAVREESSLRRVDVSAAIQVGASYGVTVLANAGPDAKAFVAFIISAEGRRLRSAQGFNAP